MTEPLRPAPLLQDERPAQVDPRPLTRLELSVALAIFSGLIFVLGVAAAVMVRPSLVDLFGDAWPLLAAIGFLSTLGGFWWLWWRPR